MSRGQRSTQPPFPRKCHALIHHLNQQQSPQHPKLLQHGSSHSRSDANGQVTCFSQLVPPKVEVAKTHITTAFRDLDLLSVSPFVNEGCSLPTSYVPGSLEAF